MVPIKRTVFLLTVYGMKNTVCLIGTLEYLRELGGMRIFYPKVISTN